MPITTESMYPILRGASNLDFSTTRVTATGLGPSTLISTTHIGSQKVTTRTSWTETFYIAMTPVVWNRPNPSRHSLTTNQLPTETNEWLHVVKNFSAVPSDISCLFHPTVTRFSWRKRLWIESICIITLHETSVQTIQTLEDLIIASEHAWQADKPKISRLFRDGIAERRIGTCTLSGSFNCNS